MTPIRFIEACACSLRNTGKPGRMAPKPDQITKLATHTTTSCSMLVWRGAGASAAL